jgi:hypothetical protein
MIVKLRTSPLGFECTMPIGDDHAVRGFAPLTVTAAQSLVLALINQPEVGGELTAEFKASFDQVVAEHAAVQTSDAEFLRAAGVAYD